MNQNYINFITFSVDPPTDQMQNLIKIHQIVLEMKYENGRIGRH